MRIETGKWCVYAHYVGDECIYIGMGRSWRAFNAHKRSMEWFDCVKDGYDVEILFWYETQAECLIREKALIGELKPICNKMHNGWVPDAFKKNWTPGRRHSEDSNRRRSETLQGRQKPAGAGRRPTPIRCMETGATYRSLPDAAEQTGISIASISLVVRGQRKSTCGLTFARLP